MLLHNGAKQILEHFLKHGNLKDCYQYERHQSEISILYPQLSKALEIANSTNKNIIRILRAIKEAQEEY